MNKKTSLRALILVTLLLSLLGLAGAVGSSDLRAQTSAGMPGPGDWPMFLNGAQRQAWNGDETALSPSTAPSLRLKWKAHISEDVVATSPAIVGDTAYIGAWDGYEYALNLTDGSVRWQTNLGTSHSDVPACMPMNAGVTSGAAVSNGLVYVGGGANYFYTLRADNGQPVWRLFTGDAAPEGASYNWASPLVAGGRVYSGIASFCDHPFVRGFAWSADSQSGLDEKRVYIVPEDTLGGGIWTSPTLDEAHNRMFLTTGSPPGAPPYLDSIVAVDLATYRITDSWRVPHPDEVADADWSTTPTLFTPPGGKQMVAAGNKNGKFYAFDADRLGAGPVWEYKAAESGECPQCGEGTISSSAYHDGVLYIAGGKTTVGGENVNGSVRAFEAATGRLRWEYPTGGSVFGSLAGANGVIVAAGDNELHLIDAARGVNLFKVVLEGAIYGAPVIAHGVVYVPTAAGFLYAYEVPAELVTPAPSAPASTATASVPAGAPSPTTQPPAALNRVPPPGNSAVLYFEPVGHTLAPPLRGYWEKYGGLAQFGYPLTEAYTETITPAGGERKDYLVQYFERARFEYHPEYAGTSSEVLLGLLGAHFFKPEPPSPQSSTPGASYLNGHNLGGPFLDYWQTHGGLYVNGYPISEEHDDVAPTDGKTYRVQYFERARFELHPENRGTPYEVLLGLLGKQLLQERGWLK